MTQPVKKKLHSWALYLSILIITSLAVVTSILLVRLYSSSTVRTRLYEEMQNMSRTQADIIRHEINDQYKPLNMLAGFIKDRDSFCSEANRQLMGAVLKENRLCTLGFADGNGDAVDYSGTVIGNIGERDYFKRIISGEQENALEYLTTTRLVQDPRFLFSVPVYDGEAIVGVIFASKKVSVISDVLLSNTLFDGIERVYITDADYRVLAANSKGQQEMERRDLSGEFRYLRENCQSNHVSGGFFEENDVFVSGIPIDVNGWNMVCVLDKEQAYVAFAGITASQKRLANTITAVLLAALLYTVFMTGYRIYHYQKGEERMYNQYSGYHALLERMNCAFVEYSVATDTLSANRFFMNKYAGSEGDTGSLTMQQLQQIHPEFNFSELDEAIRLVQKNKESISFETAITFSDGKIYWIEITLMPQAGLNGHITEILAVVVDTTKAHRSDDEEFISNVPNGIHRCFLSNPIHVEFVGKGMCQMLGLSPEEFNEAILPDRKLIHLIHPEDREHFAEFITNAAQKEGRYRCEYRMRKKDGSFISVLDVMDAKRTGSGVMYGYSSVTDITDFHRAEETGNAKLRAAEAEIEKHISRERKMIVETNKRRREMEDLEERLRSAQLKNSISQMQPHFLYNALASIREIVLEDPKYASDLIYDFSTHLRACIRAMSHTDLVPFEQEIANINAYVNIEKMRFGEKLQTVFDIRDKDFNIVPLSIQPLVENAIRHGIYQRGAKGGTVTVSTFLTDRFHTVRVTDDGVGFDYEKMLKELAENKRDSTGLCNLTFRLKKIMNADISVDSIPRHGTTVTVFIPIEQEKQQNENDSCR